MSFKTQISQKIVSLVFSILVVCFAIGFYVFAWEEPPAPPPGGNVPAPLNTGKDAQTKLGPLFLNTSLFPGEPGFVVAQGNVGIGTMSPGAKLHVEGIAGTDGIMFPDGTLQTTAAGIGVETIVVDCDSVLVAGTLRTYGCTAVCPAGYTVTGGGFQWSAVENGGAGKYSQPNGNGWLCGVNRRDGCTSGSANCNAQCFAVCAK